MAQTSTDISVTSRPVQVAANATPPYLPDKPQAPVLETKLDEALKQFETTKKAFVAAKAKWAELKAKYPNELGAYKLCASTASMDKIFAIYDRVEDGLKKIKDAPAGTDTDKLLADLKPDLEVLKANANNLQGAIKERAENAQEVKKYANNYRYTFQKFVYVDSFYYVPEEKNEDRAKYCTPQVPRTVPEDILNKPEVKDMLAFTAERNPRKNDEPKLTSNKWDDDSVFRHYLLSLAEDKWKPGYQPIVLETHALAKKADEAFKKFIDTYNYTPYEAVLTLQKKALEQKALADKTKTK